MQDFRNLKVWDKAHGLALDVYASTRPFPRKEIYGLTSELLPPSERISLKAVAAEAMLN
jgi:hypothetical protein